MYLKEILSWINIFNKNGSIFKMKNVTLIANEFIFIENKGEGIKRKKFIFHASKTRYVKMN